LGTLFGSVDDKRRPILRLEQPDGREGFAALIDTGFSGHLMVHEADIGQLGFVPLTGFSAVQVAGGNTLNVKLAEATLLWFNAPMKALVFVVTTPPPRRTPDDPIVLLGNSLINPHRLTIDFTLNTVEIQSDDQP
jgi:predicted aspartyl protease